MAERQSVLLTGVTGFLGSHIAIQLLNKGYAVRGTLRDMVRAESIRKVIATHAPVADHLSFFEAELTDSAVWDRATAGMDFVMHVASPFPRKLPKHEDDLIKPARDGVINVMRAALKNGVKRVIQTSSMGAIIYGKERNQRSCVYTENHWTDIDFKADTTPYLRSKTIAEKAAWHFIAANPGGTELSVICPGAILGPVLEEDFGTSANIVIKIMDGSSPAIPRIGFDIVDVRSVADLHIRAMESSKAAGERFIASEGFLWFKEVAEILRQRYPDKKIPKRILPDWCVRLFSYVEPALKPVLLDLGVERRVDHSKAVKVLEWNPLPPKEAVIACAESLSALHIV